MSSLGFHPRMSPMAPILRAPTPCVDPFALPSTGSHVAGVPRALSTSYVQAYGDRGCFVSARSNMHSRVSSRSRTQGNWSETGSDPASPISSSPILPGASPLWRPCQCSLPPDHLRTDTFSRSTRLIDGVFRSFSRTASSILHHSQFLGPSHARTHQWRSSRTE
jgi:hypothetical protein